MGREVDMPSISGSKCYGHTMGRGSIYHGKGVDMPSILGSKCHG